ncbi:MAG: hypothetical protein ACON5N_09000 [Akkermansiaceae bacterium]
MNQNCRRSLSIRILLLAGLWLKLSGVLFATDKVVTLLVTTPVHHKMEYADVRYAKIPHVGWDLNAFWHCELLSSAYRAGRDHIKQDINLVSLYGLKVNYDHRDGISYIDITTNQAKRSDNYPFTIKEVVGYTAKAIRMDFPDQDRFVLSIDGVKL